MNDEEDDLSVGWIEDYEENEAPYTQFGKCDIDSITVCSIYINKENEVTTVRKTSRGLNPPNVMQRSALARMIVEFSSDVMCASNHMYKLKKLIKYNITLEPKNVSAFVNGERGISAGNLFEYTQISDVIFKDSILMFETLNTIYLIYQEVPRTKSMTRRVKILPNKKTRNISVKTIIKNSY